MTTAKLESTCRNCDVFIESNDGLHWRHTWFDGEYCGFGDGTTAIPQWWDDTFASHMSGIVDMFAYELCAECGQGLDQHVIAPDVLGLPHAYCAIEFSTGYEV